MQRYFLTKDNFEKNIIVGDDVFHIIKVMRSKVGDLVEVCYDNSAYIVKISAISNDYIEYEIVEELTKKTENKPKIILIQGLAKGDKNDDIIKHGTELGVDEIILLQMKRSIVKIESNKIESKLIRYNKIAKEAAEQSHRNSIPDVNLITNISQVNLTQYDLKLLLDEEEAKKLDGRLLSKVDFKNIKSIVFVIGPEGGIDDKERDYYINQGFIPVSIGSTILRTETASLAFLAMINYIYMERE